MSTREYSEPLEARLLLRPYALAYLYGRRLRIHRVQELLAGIGVAIAVALVSAAMIANESIEGSAAQVIHTVVGPANLELRAREVNGLNERLLGEIQHMPGVAQAVPLLEQTATIFGPTGRVTVDLAGADVRLGQFNGLARTLPAAAFSSGGIGLTQTAAEKLGITNMNATTAQVSVDLRGVVYQLKVAAILGHEAASALSQSRVAVLPLSTLQRLAGLQGRLTRILIETKRGQQAKVRAELRRLAGGRLTVAPADIDIALLRQALRPSDQASGFFAAISGLLGLLFAFNAMLLTVPERRQAIADLRLIGAKRAVIVQMVIFQSLCLGIVASIVGLLAGYALALGFFHQSSGYLAEAFTLGTSTVVGVQPLLVGLAGGVVATLLASAVPLLDLRRERALDAVYYETASPGNALGNGTQVRLAFAAGALLVVTTVMFELRPALALVATGLLALATVLAVPLVFAGVLRAGAVLAARYERLTTLQVALTSLKATPVRSLALAATGAVAIFGGIALGGSREDLLRGIGSFAHNYAADAELLVANPGDNQATVELTPDRGVTASRIARLPGVASVSPFQGGFLELGKRRVWMIARPASADEHVLRSQLVDGNASTALERLGSSEWIVLSKQIAEEYRVGIGERITLPTPSGEIPFRVAATTTNLAWSPGVIFIGAANYSRFWKTTTPTAIGVRLAPGANVDRTRAKIARALGPGVEVSTAPTRQARIDSLTREGLSRLGEISTLLVIAAILAMAAALGSSVWQRRPTLAAMRLAGVSGPRLRQILLTESLLMLSAGCVTGAVAGTYGQAVIDRYLMHVTGFPVASLAANARPLVILALVITIVLLIAALPTWSASRVPPALALNDH
ncbi:MAG TPA: FtsX-like permease family protein [Solirubrobacteraceae bacterium]